MSKIELSILMLAYNSEDYIRDTIESLLNQSFTNFELIIIDDHSTDHTAEIINSFNDTRICYVFNQENMGCVRGRNQALNLARGEFVSFFDSDDLAHPQKYQKQIEFLKQNKSYGFIGTSAILIDKNGHEIDRWKLNLSYKKILPKMIFHNCFVLSSVVFYKDLVKDYKIPEILEIGEDYILWWYLIRRTKALNLPDYLTYYRQHEKSMMGQNMDKIKVHERVIYDIILKDIGVEPTVEDLDMHFALKDQSKITSFTQQRKNRDWLLRITENALKLPHYNALITITFILNRWIKVCHKSRGNIFLFLNGVFQISFYFKLFIYFIKWNSKR